MAPAHPFSALLESKVELEMVILELRPAVMAPPTLAPLIELLVKFALSIVTRAKSACD